jgi:hypothetical protein
MQHLIDVKAENGESYKGWQSVGAYVEYYGSPTLDQFKLMQAAVIDKLAELISQQANWINKQGLFDMTPNTIGCKIQIYVGGNL